MKKPKVLITRRWPEEVETRLLNHFDVSVNTDDVPLSQSEFTDAFKAYDAIFSTVTDRIDKHAFPDDNIRVKLIGNFGVGFKPNLWFLVWYKGPFSFQRRSSRRKNK